MHETQMLLIVCFNPCEIAAYTVYAKSRYIDRKQTQQWRSNYSVCFAVGKLGLNSHVELYLSLTKT